MLVAISRHYRIALYLGMYRSNFADFWLKMTAITRLSILEDVCMMDTAVTARCLVCLFRLGYMVIYEKRITAAAYCLIFIIRTNNIEYYCSHHSQRF